MTEVDDNKLVTLEDLEEKIVTEWDNEDKVSYAKENMEKLKKMKFNNFSETVLNMALHEVLSNAGGWTNYDGFNRHVNSIVHGHQVPFSMLTIDKVTGVRDFWLVRSVVNVVKYPEYIVGGENGEVEKRYNKKTVLMSKQFLDYLRKYCKEVLKDQVQFWIFSHDLGGQQHLDMNKFSASDKVLLANRGDNNPNDILMFQFKKKVPEVMVGRT